MTERFRRGEPGWIVSRSITMELDVILTAIAGGVSELFLSPNTVEFVRSVPADWRAQWSAIMPTGGAWVSALSPLAAAAGVLWEEDYTQATLAVRQLTLDDVLKYEATEAARYGVYPDERLPKAERFADLSARTVTELFGAVGLQPVAPDRHQRMAATEAVVILPFLRDGERHTLFWHLIDRLYYECYRPWREQHLSEMEDQGRRALAALGERQHLGKPPDLSWLPPQNSLHARAEIGAAVLAGKFPVMFWVQPFGLCDSWSLSTELISVSFDAPERALHNFRTRVDEISERTKALSDPTRLSILRLIRNFSMDNTEMADYLGLARPTVSIHAKLLREAGLIETRAEGRTARHAVNAVGVRKLFKDLIEFLDLPDEGDAPDLSRQAVGENAPSDDGTA